MKTFSNFDNAANLYSVWNTSTINNYIQIQMSLSQINQIT